MRVLVRYRFHLISASVEQRFVDIVCRLSTQMKTKLEAEVRKGPPFSFGSIDFEPELTELRDSLRQLPLAGGFSSPRLGDLLPIWECVWGDKIELDLLYESDNKDRINHFIQDLKTIGASDVDQPVIKHVADSELFP